ncbi:hypothetical protein NLI96_g248 [Meripilus lineatus]|uniref:Uncharacterized protein n=1 Tax=Meripilus lineatus TaxID=2056292 RepID=A0AAD5VD29_9APHY|nr:hypothetical protein NLI96_g248 [Physisporinus lineatus]
MEERSNNSKESKERKSATLKNKRSFDLDERPPPSFVHELPSSDPQLQKLNEGTVPTHQENVRESPQSLTVPSQPIPQAPSPTTPQDIHRLFRSGTANSISNPSLEPDFGSFGSPPPDDPILGVHVDQVHTSLPTIVHPHQRPAIVTANTNVAEIVLGPESFGSPEVPRAPPPSPFDMTVAQKASVEHMEDWTDEVGNIAFS